MARGHTAEVFLWPDGLVMKLFYPGFPYPDIELEARNARVAHDAGIPTPDVGDLVEIEGRRGLLFERVNGVSALDAMIARPWTFYRYDRLLPELHARMHRQCSPELPSLRERLQSWICSGTSISCREQNAALELLTHLPDGRQLCHGDFHPGNILLTTNGPVIIDWFNAASGHQVADVAITSLSLLAGSPPMDLSPTLRALSALGRRWLHSCYMRFYARLIPFDPRQFAAWRMVVAAAMLNHNSPLDHSILRAVLRPLTAS